jgi:7-carboxy-7-deazaguanine synthase
MQPRNIRVSEIFGPTAQGEGMLIGKPTVFVRTGGCDYQFCSWCDSLYAVLPEYKSEWKSMTAEQILLEVEHLSGNTPILVTLSGGNPAIQPLEELIDLGHVAGYTFAIETQGSIPQDWFSKLDYLTFSPKPPSSKQTTRWDRLDRCLSLAKQQGNNGTLCLKIVIFDEEDYVYARTVAARYQNVPLYLQVGNDSVQAQELNTAPLLSRLDWLIQKVIKDKWYSVSILPQLHVLLWGNTRGV